MLLSNKIHIESTLPAIVAVAGRQGLQYRGWGGQSTVKDCKYGLQPTKHFDMYYASYEFFYSMQPTLQNSY